MIERISILGTGLIGGSLGLAWRARRPDCTIVGHDQPEVLDKAQERGAIDEKAADPITAVDGADLVVLSTPLATILKLLDTIGEHVEDGTIITDVGSVKGPVLSQADDVLPDGVHFLGGHPMAGAEHAGIDHADTLLFENAVYVLSLPENQDDDALDGPLAPLVDLIEATGARPLLLPPNRHDRLVAAVSHLPQLLAVALVNTVAEAEEDDASDLALELAGGGFRDMTRIAASPFDMWRDILVGNESAIHDATSAFTRTLRTLRNRLIEDDLEALEDAFDDAQSARDAVPGDTKGFLHPLADVYVRAPDEPGIIHQLTGHLVDADLNIKDIELQKIREGTGGTFRLAFEDGADADAAVATPAGARRVRPRTARTCASIVFPPVKSPGPVGPSVRSPVTWRRRSACATWGPGGGDGRAGCYGLRRNSDRWRRTARLSSPPASAPVSTPLELMRAAIRSWSTRVITAEPSSCSSSPRSLSRLRSIWSERPSRLCMDW